MGFWNLSITAAITIAAAAATGAQQPTALAQPTDAGQIMQRMTEYLKGLPAFECDFRSQVETTASGLYMRYETDYTILVRRSGGFSVRCRGGMSGPEYVCDAKKLTIYLPIVHMYEVADAPAEAMDALDAERLGYLGEFYREYLAEAPGMKTLLSQDPVAVTRSTLDRLEYVGLEEVEGVSAHHLRMSDDARNHNVWIAAGENPYPVRFSFEPSADMGDDPFWQNMKSEQSLTVTRWNSMPILTDESFTFVAPDDAKEVDDLASAAMDEMFGGEESGQDESELLGRAAPDFKLDSLDGSSVSLTDLVDGQRVVVLDFWATWCPPCREGLPVVSKTMAQYSEDQAIFYAVNVMEESGEVGQFLDDQGLKIHVLFDSDGTVSDQYGVTGIPHTAVIGPDGTIQSVHVGFSPDVGDRLKEEIDTLLAGKSLVEARNEAIEKSLDLANLDRVWTLEGNWCNVAVDESGAIVALGQGGGRLARIAPDGKVVSDVHIQSQDNLFILAHLVEGDREPGVVTFSPWGPAANAFSADGKRLWTYRGGDGIDDVSAADLDGDGLDEVIIGYNGFTGLHVVSHSGDLLWKDTHIGNVWHVTAADVAGDQRPEVITTSAVGRVHVFDQEGKNVRNLDTGVYAEMVRASTDVRTGQTNLYVAGNRVTGSTGGVVKLTRDGNKQWSLDLPGESSPSIDALAMAQSDPLAALSTSGGNLHLIDTNRGEVIGHYSAGQRLLGVAWMRSGGDEPPLLLIADGASLMAVKPASAPAR